jgi:hypothetical protein
VSSTWAAPSRTAIDNVHPAATIIDEIIGEALEQRSDRRLERWLIESCESTVATSGQSGLRLWS